MISLNPVDDIGVVLIEATDGYSFFVSMEEIKTNENLLLVSQESDGESVFNIVGAASTKAWVRGVNRIAILPKDTLEVSGNVEASFRFAPQDWQDKMDSIYFSIDDETEKLQGVPIYELVDQAQPTDKDCSVVLSSSQANENLDCALKYLITKMSGYSLIQRNRVLNLSWRVWMEPSCCAM